MAPPVTPSPHRFMIKNDTPGPMLAGSQFNATPRFNFTPTSQTKSIKETPKFVFNPFHTSTENKPVKNDIPKFSLKSDFQASSGKKPAQNEIPKFVLNPSDFQISTENKTIKNGTTLFSLNSIDFPATTGKKPTQHDSIEIESDNSSESGMSLNEDSFTEIRSGSESKSEINEEPASKRRKKPLSPRSFEKPIWLKNEANKLRRKSDDVIMPLPATPTLSSSKPKNFDQIKVPRFLISSPDHMLTSKVLKENLIFAKPPVFRPPDLTTQQNFQTDPNPDLFSPHRRGEKYIGGGLAAELRNWLVNIKSSIPTSQKGRKDPWLFEILVEDFNGSNRIGMILVKGRRLQVTGVEKKDFVGEVKIILASEISSIGLQKSSNVEKGRIIGIKGPIWEVTIQNEKWAVGVDWK
ncbi:hypothetical protein EPUL_004533, partial [Erysiphe pulchra]